MNLPMSGYIVIDVVRLKPNLIARGLPSTILLLFAMLLISSSVFSQGKNCHSCWMEYIDCNDDEAQFCKDALKTDFKHCRGFDDFDDERACNRQIAINNAACKRAASDHCLIKGDMANLCPYVEDQECKHTLHFLGGEKETVVINRHFRSPSASESSTPPSRNTGGSRSMSVPATPTPEANIHKHVYIPYPDAVKKYNLPSYEGIWLVTVKVEYKEPLEKLINGGEYDYDMVTNWHDLLVKIDSNHQVQFKFRLFVQSADTKWDAEKIRNMKNSGPANVNPDGTATPKWRNESKGSTNALAHCEAAGTMKAFHNTNPPTIEISPILLREIKGNFLFDSNNGLGDNCYISTFMYGINEDGKSQILLDFFNPQASYNLWKRATGTSYFQGKHESRESLYVKKLNTFKFPER